MAWLDAIGDLNWWAVLVATASTFLVGFVFYASGALGKRWAGLVGLTEEEMSSSAGAGPRFAATGVASLLTAILLGALILATGVDGLWEGLLFGAVIGLVFRAGAHVIHNGFAHLPTQLTVIDGVHDVIALAVMGAILGVWQ
ncbi:MULTISPECIES: DUF1761 domain-containing protein [Oerskovia]|uniref:DUF1761 domain-containing protein n=1 Tax=Oerskovia merdavium TaxID=2762227 RepID=A0ABR8TYY5_9CELL|nr:DUF1761 domain-containing protein [Oerskovia merdavium]MBD7980794.1 DUF1761 domain-containing protein [Oerskovia merdavium]